MKAAMSADILDFAAGTKRLRHHGVYTANLDRLRTHSVELFVERGVRVVALRRTNPSHPVLRGETSHFAVAAPQIGGWWPTVA